MVGFFSQLFTNPQIQPFLPFLFVFAIAYGLLNIAKVFKQNSVNVILALVFGFFAAGYSPFVNFFFTNFNIILWAFVIMFFIAFSLEVFGLKGKKKGDPQTKMMMIGIIIILFMTVGFGLITKFDIPVIGMDNFLIIIGLFLLGIIFYAAYELGKETPQPQQKQG